MNFQPSGKIFGGYFSHLYAELIFYDTAALWCFQMVGAADFLYSFIKNKEKGKSSADSMYSLIFGTRERFYIFLYLWLDLHERFECHCGQCQLLVTVCLYYIWDKVFKNGPNEICGRQPLKNLSWNFLKAVFHKFYLVHSLILWPICEVNIENLKQFSFVWYYCWSIQVLWNDAVKRFVEKWFQR